MNCADMDVVLHVLNVFYVFGKRSNFLSRLYARLKSNLSTGLEHMGRVSTACRRYTRPHTRMCWSY